MEFFRPEYWSGELFPSPGDLTNSGIELRSSILQADSLPDELSGKSKNTELGSLSLLQWIVLTQESNWGLLHCRRILYQLSYQGCFCSTTRWISYIVYIKPLPVEPSSHCPHPTPLSHHRASSWAPWTTVQTSTSYFTHGGVFMSNLISQFIPPSPSSLCPHVHSLHLYLYSYPVTKFICARFLIVFFLPGFYLESSTHFPVLVFKMLTSPSITPTASLENTQFCACMKHCMSPLL